MTKIVLKGIGVVAAFAMFVGVAVPSASALSLADVELLIALGIIPADQADAARAAVGGSATGSTGNSAFCGPFTRSLTVGSTGADVTQLQTALESTGDLVIPVGVSKGYFGPLTQSALAGYQAQNAITPSAGYFGPITMASFANRCSAAPSTGDNGSSSNNSGSNTLQGGAGSIEDAEFISSLNNEEVGEGQDDVEVAGLEIEADGSDIELTAVTLNFDYADTGADDELDEYASEVSVWFNGEEVARLDADEFEDDDNFQKTVALDRGAIIEEDEMGDLVVAVSGINNLDSTSVGENWNVSFVSVRFRDAQNAIITDSTTGDIGETDDDTTTDSDEVGFSFESFATANDVELKVSDGDDDINDARTIEVDDDNDTDEEEILSFMVEAEGGSDLEIDDLSVDFTSVGAGVGEIINSAELWVDGESVDSQNIASSSATTSTVTFDNLGWVLDAGDEVEVIVTVNLNNLEGNFTAGDTLMAEVNPDDAAWDVEDEDGEDLSAADKTGSATSEAHSFFADGLNITMGAADTASFKDTNGDSAGGEQGLYTIKFDVTAFGDDIYIPLGWTITTSSVDTDDGIAFTIEDSDGMDVALNGGGTATATAAVKSTANTAGTGNQWYRVSDGQTEQFTLDVTFTPIADGFYYAVLDSVNFNVGSAAVADTNQDATPEEDFETDSVSLDI